MNNHSAFFRKAKQNAGFSLIEMMTVVVVISVLLVLAAPAFTRVSGSLEISISATTLADSLNLARQTALSSNRPVEVRFYEVPAPSGFTGKTTVIGIFRIDDDGPHQMRQLISLEKRVRMAQTEKFGPLLLSTPSATGKISSLDPTGATTYPYHYFQFRPDGSTNLAASSPGNDTWHVMLYNLQQPPTADTPPANYATIQLDPVTGRTKTFRPRS
ncbi:MAG: Verru_Chthon cassette protein D [Candidatus Methylacidiphilales bacterium]|nr:Verru_Chthon cassette protein D [Candidatus Methylacidiphilales bacterium]